MCGITGWVAFDRDLRSERGTLEQMTATMACRGPDDEGEWVGDHAMLGHRRLAVIDLPGGRQPMTLATADGTVALVFSGEIYNYVELREELVGRGHRFTTASDTEVLLHAYLEWDVDAAERLNGMFAFAVWDDRIARLLLVRDRVGVKPLYYYPTAGGVLFGSEAKAILANSMVEPVVGLDGMREVVSYTKTPGNAVWEGMYEVEPGGLVTVDASGLRRHTYWTLSTVAHPDDRRTTLARTRELLEDIVARQLVADVPRCMLLSGGLDSSSLTALAADRLAATDERIRSFSVDFVGRAEHFTTGEGIPQLAPDAPYAEEVATRSGTLHHAVVLDAASLADPEIRAKVVRARDVPTGLGDTETSLYLLFSEIRRHSTVALSGESADELFGGYTQFFDADATRADVMPWNAHFARQQRVEHDLLVPDVARALDLENYARDNYAAAVGSIERLAGESDDEYRMRKVSYFHLTRFVRQLLDRKDRLSMAVGLEVRVPFCDHRLVEYVYNTPWAMKTYDGREKSLLRGAVADLLPRSVLERKKSGYPATPDPEYARLVQKQAAGLLDTPGHPVFDVLRREALQDVVATAPDELDQPRRGRLDRYLDFATWMELYSPRLVLA